MSKTNSLAFPNLFDVASNHVNVLEDNTSVINRTRLLMLTEPTELYNSIDFGVGLKRHLWKYNTANEIAIIKDRIIDQLRLNEPSVDADETVVLDEAIHTGPDPADVSLVTNQNKLNMTVGLCTVFGDKLTLSLDKAELESELYNKGTHE